MQRHIKRKSVRYRSIERSQREHYRTLAQVEKYLKRSLRAWLNRVKLDQAQEFVLSIDTKLLHGRGPKHPASVIGNIQLPPGWKFKGFVSNTDGYAHPGWHFVWSSPEISAATSHPALREAS